MVDPHVTKADGPESDGATAPVSVRLAEMFLPPALISLLALAGLQAGYLLFHLLAELTAILIGLTTLVIATTSRRFARNHFLYFIGVGLGWCALVDLFHALSYPGMNLVPGGSTNLAAQWWIAARGLQALTLLVAPVFFFRPLPRQYAHLAFGLVVAALAAAIVTGHFPDCFVDGRGLTDFKVYAEYVVILALMGSAVLMWRWRALMSGVQLAGLISAVGVMVLSEYAFTLYAGPTATANAVGHLLKIFGYWFAYVALVQSALRDPFTLLTRAASTFDAVPDPSIVVDHAGVVLQANLAAVTLAGRARTEIVGARVHQLFHDPAVAESECVICERVARGDTRFFAELRRGASSLECSVAPYAEHASRLARVEVYRDVTERNAAQEGLGFHARRVEALLSLPAEAGRMEEAEFMRYAMDRAEELTGSRIAFIHFINEDQESIELITWSRRTLDEYCHAAYDKHYPISAEGIWADAFRRREPVVFNDYANAPERRGLPTGHSALTRLISLPVLEGGKVRMMAGIGNKETDYTPLDVETLRLISDSVWRIVRQQRQQQEMEASEERYRKLFDNNPTVCLLIDPEAGTVVEANTAATRFYGWGQDRMRGMLLSEINVLSEGQIAAEIRRAQNRSLEMFEFRHRLADGSVRDVAVYSGPIEMGEKKLLLSMVHDITDRNRMTAELEAAQQRFAEVFEAAPIPMQLMDLRSGRMLALNRSMRDWLGYDLADVPDTDRWMDMVYDDPVVRKQLRAHWSRSLDDASQTPAAVSSPELMLRAKDGRRFIARGRVTVVDAQVVVAWTDLTEIRRSETELRDSEQRFRRMIEQAVTGIYVRRDGCFRYVNDSFCAMVGHPRDALLGRAVADLVPPDADGAQPGLPEAADRAGALPAESLQSLMHSSGRTIQCRAITRQIEWDGGLADIVMVEDVTVKVEADRKVAAYVSQVEAAMKGTLNVVSRMVEARDPYTAGHERRVGLIAKAIAGELGWTQERCEALEMVGMVHDIGKITVPSEILSKPGRLTAVEMALVRGHAEAGYLVLKDVQFPAPVAEIIRQHHERMDGSGYPQGLKGDDILIEARVLAVADVFESMSSHRPYRASLGVEAAMDELAQGRGVRFDADVVDALTRLVREREYKLPD